MTLKHTPGPWATNTNGLITAGPRRLHIAQTAVTGMGHAAEANAFLLAAAPELLAALEQIERLSREADRSLVDVRAMLGDIARAAIRKALEG